MPAGEGRASSLTEPRVSVIALADGRDQRGAALRKALERQGSRDFELLWADVSFADVAAADSARVIRPGPAIAMNLAAAGARGRILAFLACELGPLPGWLEAIGRAFEHSPDADVVAGRTVIRLGGSIAVAETALEATRTVAGSPCTDLALHCAVRREAFERFGGFDEAAAPVATAHRILGGLLLDREAAVRRPDDMVAIRAPAAGVREFLGRQYDMGAAAYYSLACGGLAGRVARGLVAPLRAVRLAGYKRQLAPVLALLALAGAARLLGGLAGLVRGGRRRGSVPSPLVGPESESLVGEGPGGRRPTASVIVPVHGSPEWAAMCFGSLARQDTAEPYEIIAVFDRYDDLVARLRNAFPRLRCCFCLPEDGPGGARNRAIGAARGQYLAFTDDDCMAEKDWLRGMVAACRQSGGGAVRGWVETAHLHSYVARAFNVGERGMGRPSGRCSVPGLGGNSMCVSRSVLECSGARFAEGVYGAEEIAFLRELPADRRSVLLEPAAVVRHLRAESPLTSLARHYRMGWGSGWLRGRRRMRGSLFARHVWLAPLLVPARFLLTASRIVRYGPASLLDFVRLSPFIMCQYVWYAVGFAAGAVSARRAKGPSPERARGEKGL